MLSTFVCLLFRRSMFYTKINTAYIYHTLAFFFIMWRTREFTEIYITVSFGWWIIFDSIFKNKHFTTSKILWIFNFFFCNTIHFRFNITSVTSENCVVQPFIIYKTYIRLEIMMIESFKVTVFSSQHGLTTKFIHITLTYSVFIHLHSIPLNYYLLCYFIFRFLVIFSSPFFIEYSLQIDVCDTQIKWMQQCGAIRVFSLLDEQHDYPLQTTHRN